MKQKWIAGELESNVINILADISVKKVIVNVIGGKTYEITLN